jgi:hypothetical protein
MQSSMPNYAAADLVVGALISAHQRCILEISISATCKILRPLGSVDSFVDRVQCQRGDAGTGRQVCLGEELGEGGSVGMK